MPKEETPQLSDSYIDKPESPLLELKVKIKDIDLSENVIEIHDVDGV
ncbi:MAG: hypothetical protein K2J60_02815 [Acetatifactor sp.]|nr:hypothetical protein [Acetatifactor sp.]